VQPTDSPNQPPAIDSIQWPNGMDKRHFLDHYWQKKPLLIRQAFADFSTPLTAEELAGLSLEQDVASKLIRCDDQGEYHLEYGPFDESYFQALTDDRWSLLVTDVEKYVPELACWLEPFRFLPDWRIDDLMISYAPNGSSVGAHVDEYDVFLLQASGTRHWAIDARTNSGHQHRQHGDLKILAKFEPSDSWDLQPGDMLYLPPGIAHHGIARGNECTTWSIGFRAPLLSEMVARLSELLSETLPHSRYADGRLTPAVPGEISADTITRFKKQWHAVTTLSDEQFSDLLGQWLTQSAGAADYAYSDTSLAIEGGYTDALAVNNGNGTTISAGATKLCKAPFSKFAWIADTYEPTNSTTNTYLKSSSDVTLFVDGTSDIRLIRKLIDLECLILVPEHFQ